MIRTLSNSLFRMFPGRGLGSGWEEYQYMDALAASTGDPIYTSDAYYQSTGPVAVPFTTSNDVGVGFASSLWSTIGQLGSTYLQGQTQENIAKTVTSTVRPGTMVTASPSGGVVATSAPLPSSTVYLPQPGQASTTFDTLLKNPLVWAAVAAVVILPPLLRKKK